MPLPSADMSSEPGRETLETERLWLRRQSETDAAVFRQLWGERDPRVPPHRRIDAEGRPSVTDIAQRIRSERDGPWPGLLTVERKDSGEVIGYCGLVVDAQDRPEIAFELLSATHNRGYATEAAREVLAWVSDAGYPRVWASVWDWNVASRRVLEKLGFHDTGETGRVSEHGRTLVTARDLSAGDLLP